MKQAQQADQNLHFLLAWLRTSEVPSEGDLFIASPACKYYWIDKICFY